MIQIYMSASLGHSANPCVEIIYSFQAPFFILVLSGDTITEQKLIKCSIVF